MLKKTKKPCYLLKRSSFRCASLTRAMDGNKPTTCSKFKAGGSLTNLLYWLKSVRYWRTCSTWHSALHSTWSKMVGCVCTTWKLWHCRARSQQHRFLTNCLPLPSRIVLLLRELSFQCLCLADQVQCIASLSSAVMGQNRNGPNGLWFLFSHEKKDNFWCCSGEGKS